MINLLVGYAGICNVRITGDSSTPVFELLFCDGNAMVPANESGDTWTFRSHCIATLRTDGRGPVT